MRARYIKFIIWIIALVAVWKLGQSDAVVNSLFVFAAAGVVPGTSIVLRPQEVLWLLSGVLVLAVLLIFSTNLRRAVGRMWARVSLRRQAPAAHMASTPAAVLAATAQPVAVVSAAIPIPLKSDAISVAAAVAAPGTKPKKQKKQKYGTTPGPLPVAVISLPKRPGRLRVALHAAGAVLAVAARTQLMTLQKHLPRATAAGLRAYGRMALLVLGTAKTARHITVAFAGTVRAGAVLGGTAIWRTLLGAARFVGLVLRRVAHAGRHAANRIAKAVGYAIKRSAAAVRYAAIRTTAVSVRTAIRFWQWLEPRLRTFDGWLGVRYHRFLADVKRSEAYKLAHSFAREIGKIIAGIWAEVCAVFTRAVQK